MQMRMKPIVKMRVNGKAVSHSRTDVSVRDLVEIVDEPEIRGGTNKGASPTETLLIALAACTNVVSHMIAKKIGVDIDAMDIGVVSEFDRRGVMLEEQVLVPFPNIDLSVKVTTSADDAQVEQIKTDLQKFCPIANVIRQSGTTIEENWEVIRP